MKGVTMMVMFFLGQSPADMKKTMEEFERIDCEAVYATAQQKCLSECAVLKREPETKGTIKTCINQCDTMFSGMEQQCQKMKKEIEKFKKKSLSEQEKILREASHESSRGHYHHHD